MSKSLIWLNAVAALLLPLGCQAGAPLSEDVPSSNAGAPFAEYGRSSNAEKMSLNGEWKFRTDPEDVGLGEKWQAGQSAKSWDTIRVPSAFNIAKKELWNYEGVAWYQRTLKLSKRHLANGNRVYLRFLGASLRKKVWVNGDLVGEDISPYSPFEFDATQACVAGDNVIVLRTDTRRIDKSVPDRKWNGWWNYGGPYRDVYAEIRPAAFIKYLWMDTDLDEGWTFRVHAELEMSSEQQPQPQSVEFLLKDSKGAVVWKKRAGAHKGLVKVEDSLEDVDPWAPGSPTLYTLTARLGDHAFTINTAFRDIETRGARIYLNGKPIKLYGMNYHEDHEKYGNAIPVDVMKKDLDAIREIGATFLRTGHYTSHPYLFDYCDRNGILVWTEIPAWKTSRKTLASDSAWKTYIAPQLKAMVREYRQHPCVAFWSVGNEFGSNRKEGANYVKRAVEYVKSLDDTRLLTFASDKRLKDKAAQYVDVIGWNEYYGWYYGTINDLGGVLDQGHAKWPDKPILISEFGAGGPYNRPTGGGDAVKGKQYTLEYQCRLIETHLKQIYAPERDFVVGGALWCFNDFADPHRHGKGHPKDWYQINTKGVVTRDRKRKPAFETIKQFYLSEQKQKD